MTQKTAIMLMIEMIESVRRDEPPTALWNLKKYAQELLATEKEHIIDAWDNAYSGWKSEDVEFTSGEQYYEQTFGNSPSPKTQTE